MSSWDAIIIGSGLGGMTTGTLLAKAGKKVLLLERHSVPGGFTHTFTRKGFEWDVGVHYVGKMNGSSILKKIFDFVTDHTLKWDFMGSIYDRIIIGTDSYDFVTGVNNHTLQLIRYFPDEEKAIRKYMKLVQSAAGSGPYFFGEKTSPLFFSNTLGRLLRYRCNYFSQKTTLEVLQSLTQNRRLIAVLSAQCGNYGMSPNKSSFFIHASIVEHYLQGGSYPRGGASKIHESLLNVFRKNGGTLITKAEVSEIIIQDGKANGVTLKDGRQFYADSIISNAGFLNTFNKLLPTSVTLPSTLKKLLPQVHPSIAHACLYVGLKGTDQELNLPKHNIWVYPTEDFDAGIENVRVDPLHPDSLTYISFPSTKDSTWNNKYPGKSTVQVITPCYYESVEKWEKLPWSKRGPDYLEFKKKLTEKLLEKLLTCMPQLEGHIEYTELSTPLSTKHFAHYSKGEIYGLEHSPARFKFPFLRPQTLIPGLFLTGQDIVTVGVGGALYSGVLAATKVLKKSVILRILFNRPL